MKVGDIVEYTDQRGDKHDATIANVMEQPTNIEGTATETILNLEYHAGGRDRRAELVTAHPNASGQCYGKVKKEAPKPTEAEIITEADSDNVEASPEPENPSEDAPVTETAEEAPTPEAEPDD